MSAQKGDLGTVTSPVAGKTEDSRLQSQCSNPTSKTKLRGEENRLGERRQGSKLPPPLNTAAVVFERLDFTSPVCPRPVIAPPPVVVTFSHTRSFPAAPNRRLQRTRSGFKHI